MKKLNFQEFSMPTGVSRKAYRQGDGREAMADLIYNNVNGIAAHRLAFKIYDSSGPTEYTDREVSTIVNVAERFASPGFIDGIRTQLDNPCNSND